MVLAHAAGVVEVISVFVPAVVVVGAFAVIVVRDRREQRKKATASTEPSDE